MALIVKVMDVDEESGEVRHTTLDLIEVTYAYEIERGFNKVSDRWARRKDPVHFIPDEEDGS